VSLPNSVFRCSIVRRSSDERAWPRFVFVLPARDERRPDGARYRIRRLEDIAGVRWYRFTLDDARVLAPVERCAAEP
jgi:hypothetical protein